ncbi:hypothetical protein A2U01_0008677, partial [Trifolium medium]|nr:hypothetical protein [Trifolium medium]
ESIFLNGLKDEVQAEMKLYDHQDLADMMDRALLIEEKNDTLKKRGIIWRYKGDWKEKCSGSKFRNPGEFYKDKKEVPKPMGGETKSNDVLKGRRLSPSELEDRHKRGLCFKCGEKWGRDHTCKFKHMSLRLCEGDSSEEEVEGVQEEVIEEVARVEEFKTLQLSLQSKEGFTSNQSFKVWVKIGDKKLLTLIDSGASSNFIASKLVKELELPLVDTPTYVIEVGNGENVSNNGVCRDLTFQLQGVQFQQNFFLMELGGTDMALGMDWLASLGNIEANFGELCLKWKSNGFSHKIQGDPAMCTRQASLKAMVKALADSGVGYYLQSMSASNQEEHVGGVDTELTAIIREFEEVFNMPSGLPPIREHDHAIILKPGADIPNIRPYRYPFYQKNEIDDEVSKQVFLIIVSTGIVVN